MKIFIILVMFISLLQSTQQKDFDGWFYNSSFGFIASNIPENWTIITQENSQSILAPLLKQGVKYGYAKKINLETLKEVEKLINTGTYEILIYKNNLGMLLVGPVSNKKLSLDWKEKLFCGSLSSELQKKYNRIKNTAVDYCKQRKIFGIDTVSYKFDSVAIGFKTIGYSFNTEDKMISFSLICKDVLCNKLQEETEKIFKNLKFSIKLHATNEQINKKIKKINNFLSNEFCKDDSFFMNCFITSKSNCLNMSKKSVYDCSVKNKNILYDSEKLKHAGEIIGRCAGENIVNYLGSYKNTGKCNSWFQ